ncbi:MAG: RNA 2'-phosphotransferase [Desulfobacteraceae bacterium]
MKSKHVQKLAKFITYVLGRRPDEFGLVPDEQGYVRIKELIKSLNEEEGWRHIRQAHLNEIGVTATPCPIEIQGNRVRASSRSQLPKISVVPELPKLLYTAVRRRAYPSAVEKGIQTAEREYLVLCANTKMAERIGKRRDNHPVILTVQVSSALDAGTRFYQYGENLYLADTIFPNTFTGPALPKEKPAAVNAQKTSPPPQPKTPGSYFPDLSQPNTSKRRRKEADWKKERRRARRHKARQQG